MPLAICRTTTDPSRHSTKSKENNRSKGYIIGHVTLQNAEAYKAYVTRNTPIIASYGGRPLVRGGASENPDDDPAYQEVAQIRRDNATSMIVVVEGV